MTIRTLILKAINKGYKLSRDGLLRLHDGLLASYGRPKVNADALQALQSADLTPFQSAAPAQDLAAIQNILAHRFNFLGSGWITSVVRNNEPPLLNLTNRTVARQASALLSQGYQRLDWQSDPKSDHRWLATIWHSAVRYGKSGEEILMPWTLGRMQQLPFLARCWADPTIRAELDSSTSGPDLLPNEFQNEVLDFIAANPPHWGVQWASPMDAAIRAINWLAAYDILTANGYSFPEPFLHYFQSSLWDHARFIWRHQEWDPVLRNNHYLADLSGLIVIAAHFPTSRRMQRWLRISTRRLIREIHSQFNPDGSTTEAATCYHLLSSELVTLALSALFSLPSTQRRSLQQALGSNQENTLFPAGLYQHLKHIQQFMDDVIMEDGQALQVGDNDSGRILKLESHFWAETEPSPLPRHFAPLQNRMRSLLEHFDAWNQLDRPHNETSPVILILQDSLPSNSPCPQPIQGWRAYPGMGLYLFRNDNYALSIRCGPIGQNGIGGHAHNDQLSLTLHVHGQPVIVDPGSYCYSSDPQTRMAFRSTASHNTLSVHGLEQNTISPPEKMLFKMIDLSRAKGEIVDETTFTGAHWGFGKGHTRSVRALPAEIEIEDA
ncbi:MAG: alginate lyase family protein, partial [Anaerolineaceae bacterium]|nr:alginate lyase family protein [Anaerolineaceae bacterium]